MACRQAAVSPAALPCRATPGEWAIPGTHASEHTPTSLALEVRWLHWNAGWRSTSCPAPQAALHAVSILAQLNASAAASILGRKLCCSPKSLVSTVLTDTRQFWRGWLQVLELLAACTVADSQSATQVVREKVFTRLREEVPYEVQLAPVSFELRRDGSYLIEQDVLVPTKNVRMHPPSPLPCLLLHEATWWDASHLQGGLAEASLSSRTCLLPPRDVRMPAVVL